MEIAVINLHKYRKQTVQVIPDIAALKLYTTKTYNVDQINREYAKSFLSSLEEGIFGFEWYKTNEKTSLHFFQSESINLNVAKKQAMPIFLSTKKQDVKQMDLYHISSQKASCFPFALNCEKSIWGELNSLPNFEGLKVFIQVVIRKKDNDNWKLEVQKQYESYLEGVDHPAPTKSIRAKFQQKLLELSDKVEDWKTRNNEIQDLATKLEEDGFRISIRLGIYGSDQKQRQKIANDILKVFRKMDASNSWGMTPILRKQSFLENMQLRRMPLLHGRYQVLSISELLPLLEIKSSLPEVKKAEFIIEKPVTKKYSGGISSKLPTLEHLPLGKDKMKRKEDISNQEQQINDALKKVGLIKGYGIKITKLQNGATLKKVTFTLPESVKLSQIENSKKDIQAELGLKNVSIEQGTEKGTAAMLIPLEERQKVYLRELIDNDEFREFCTKNELPFVLGVDTVGNIIKDCLTRIKHILVAGTTGSGKSVWLNAFLLTLMLTKTPDELRLFLIDPKFVEFPLYKQFPHVVDVITDSNKSLQLLKQLTVEMDNRYKKFAEVGCRNIAQFNKKSRDSIDYIVVVIDEFADLIMMEPKVSDEIIRLAQKARACGIHLVLATQRPEKDIVEGLIKSNIYSRICFACGSDVDYRIVLDKKPPFTLLGKGDAVCRLEGKEGFERFQGALVADGDDATDEVIEAVAAEWNGKDIVVKNELPDVEIEPEEKVVDDLTKIKRIIAATGETRIVELQKEMKIRTSSVKELMEQLVVEGWLEPPQSRTKGYQLKISSEEREIYLNEN